MVFLKSYVIYTLCALVLGLAIYFTCIADYNTTQTQNLSPSMTNLIAFLNTSNGKALITIMYAIPIMYIIIRIYLKVYPDSLNWTEVMVM